MAEVITFNIQKGGVAKTTSTIITAEILQNRGYTVLLVDFDPQRNLSHALNVDEPLYPIADVLTGKVDIRKALVKTDTGLGLLPSDRSLFELQSSLSGNVLAKVLEPIKKYFDYILIDTAPALSSLSVNALMASDKVVIPAILGEFCDLAIQDVLTTIHTIQKQNKKLEVAGILITMSKMRSTLDKIATQQYQKLADNWKIRLFSTKIRQCQKIKEAQMLKTGVIAYAPKSNAAVDYNSFVDELLNPKPIEVKEVDGDENTATTKPLFE